MSALERLGVGSVARTDTASPAQQQTANAFGYKWAQTASYGSPAMVAFTRDWLLTRYCGGHEQVLQSWLSQPRRIILDAGCGSGYSARCLFGDLLNDHDYLGIDVSSAVEVGRQEFAQLGLPGDFLQCDMTSIPIPDESVDLVLAEGSLHHTDDTGAALSAVATKLRKGGRFLLYVYAKKAPLREFADDLIREDIGDLSDSAAWTRLESLTKLGIALGELEQSIVIPEDIPMLGIKAGPTTVQRLVYYAFVKAFYRADWSFDELHHVNFDWYRPQNARRHTEDEVRAFVEDAGLIVERFHTEDSGFSVVALKPQ